MIRFRIQAILLQLLAVIGGITVVVVTTLAIFLANKSDPVVEESYDTERDRRFLEPAATAGKEHPIEFDFTGLNGGDWQFLCIVGGYENPFVTLLRTGRAVFPTHKQLCASEDVDENKAVVVFVDRKGGIKMVEGFSQFALGASRCIGREQPKMVLPGCPQSGECNRDLKLLWPRDLTP